MTQNIDWVCVDCGIVYVAPEIVAARQLPTGPFAGTGRSLPQFCPECGDHGGWKKREDVEE